MFGYVKPFACSLTQEEQTLYKSIYCGLCHSLGEIAGTSARFTLNYDLVFLALLRMAATNEEPILTIKRCPTHPFKGCSMAIEGTSIGYCAALSLLLVNESVLDKINDEKGIRRLGAKLMHLSTSQFLKKAQTQWQLPTAFVKEQLNTLYTLEKQGTCSPTEIADVFGTLLGGVSSYGIADEILAYGVEKITFHLGKWIYLVDAADDFEKDKKRSAFNPFGSTAPDATTLQNALEWELLECDRFLSKLPIENPMLRNILRNILYDGTYRVSHTVLYSQKKSKGARNTHE